MRELTELATDQDNKQGQTDSLSRRNSKGMSCYDV